MASGEQPRGSNAPAASPGPTLVARRPLSSLVDPGAGADQAGEPHSDLDHQVSQRVEKSADDGVGPRTSGMGSLLSPPRGERVTSKERRGPAAAAAADLAQSDTLVAADAAHTPAGSQSGAALPRETAQLVGTRIGERYTVLRELGRGGMSEVYVARHELLQKDVAIKVLRPELAANHDALERFHREAIAAAKVGDPRIVEVSDFGHTSDGKAYLVMELLEGQDLRRLIRSEGALPAGRAVAIARQILRGLEAAHERGIVHRDLKAENIFLGRRDGVDTVKILDFGISKLRDVGNEQGVGREGGALTSTGMVMGTPQYIAPEQAYAQSDIDHRADIYAMGVILYEMLTGELPFLGESALELMMQHVQQKPERPSRRRPDLAIPAILEHVTLKALRKERRDRFASARQMLDALPPAEELTGGYASAAVGAYAARRPSRQGLLLGGLAVSLLLGGALWFAFYGGDSTHEDGHQLRSGASATRRKGGLGSRAVAGRRTSQGLRAARHKQAVVAPGSAQTASRPSSAPTRTPALRPASEADSAFTMTIRALPRSATLQTADGRRFRSVATLRVRQGDKITLRISAPGHVPLVETLVASSARSSRSYQLKARASTERVHKRPISETKGPGTDLRGNPYQP